MRRGVVIGAGWLVGVATAAVVGMITINALNGGDSPVSSEPLSTQDIHNRLAQTDQHSQSPSTPQAAPGASATASPGASPTAPPAGTVPAQPGPQTQWSTTTGGNVQASCSGGQVTIVVASPATGYRFDGSDFGPGPSAYVRFKRDKGHGDYRVTATCDATGKPTFTVANDD